mgnify:CR=1 FL=1
MAITTVHSHAEDVLLIIAISDSALLRYARNLKVLLYVKTAF